MFDLEAFWRVHWPLMQLLVVFTTATNSLKIAEISDDAVAHILCQLIEPNRRICRARQLCMVPERIERFVRGLVWSGV